MSIAAEPLLPSSLPPAADWAAVSITAASEMTRHAPGAVGQAEGDELQRLCTATRGGGGGGNCNNEDWADADPNDANDNDFDLDDGDERPP